MARKTVQDRGWTPKEIATLERLRLDGVEAVDIAVQLQRTRTSVRSKLQKMGLVKPLGAIGWIFELMHSTEPDRVLAQRLGCSVGAVRDRRMRLRKLGYEIADRRRR